MAASLVALAGILTSCGGDGAADADSRRCQVDNIDRDVALVVESQTSPSDDTILSPTLTLVAETGASSMGLFPGPLPKTGLAIFGREFTVVVLSDGAPPADLNELCRIDGRLVVLQSDARATPGQSVEVYQTDGKRVGVIMPLDSQVPLALPLEPLDNE